jgi:Uma2 family endonuclease
VSDARGLRHHRYTYADYVGLETYSDTKHEFLDGEIYAMSGGTRDHASLSATMIHLLFNAVGDRPCDVHTSDLRIRVEAADLSTYPDASVICGPMQGYEPGPKDTALNPMILVEVTSDSSEEYDTGLKYEYYRTIATLRDYVIVSHRERRVTVHSRGAGDEWTTHVARAGERVAVPSLEAELSVDEIYRKSAVS